MRLEPLPKEKWKGCILPMSYTTEEFYDVELSMRERGFSANFIKKRFDAPITHTPEEHDFPDKLYQEHWEGAYAWGVVENGKLLAAIETCPEEWSNRLMVTELWVDESIRRRGVAHSLMALAKEQARRERRRAIKLETQSCNVNAIAFYLSEGFSLIGFDSCCYTNEDIARREVRMEMGIIIEKRPKFAPGELEIRPERPEDYHSAELMTQRAFWNKHHLGCDEHYLVHKLRGDAAYLPMLSRIAAHDGRVVGGIYYSKATVTGERGREEVLTFGPLCVDPEYQGRGIGEALFYETAKLAKKAGYKGIVIYGEPDYYPRLGFKACDVFGITTPDGKNFPAFMGYDLIPGGLNIPGAFREAEVFSDLPANEVEEYNKLFPPLEKQRFPGQWD